MRATTFRGLLLLLFLLVGVPAVIAQSPLTLSVAGTPRQGEPLFVMVMGAPAGATGVVRWADQRFELSVAGDDGIMRTVVPVAVDMPTGNRPMIAELLSKSGEAQPAVRTSVAISSRTFSSQSITINPTTLASYDNPQNKADDQRIIEVLKPFDPEKRWQGNFVRPIQARESTPFGAKRLYNGWKTGWHKGIDLAGWEGQSIHAPANGVVLLQTRGLVNGNTVVLSHGLGLGSVYLHMSVISVKTGDHVTRGQVIGKVGGTGGFDPHLHWETRVHGVPIDPHSLLALPASWR